jgi:hypothetical protein
MNSKKFPVDCPQEEKIRLPYSYWDSQTGKALFEVILQNLTQAFFNPQLNHLDT